MLMYNLIETYFKNIDFLKLLIIFLYKTRKQFLKTALLSFLLLVKKTFKYFKNIN